MVEVRKINSWRRLTSHFWKIVFPTMSLARGTWMISRLTFDLLNANNTASTLQIMCWLWAWLWESFVFWLRCSWSIMHCKWFRELIILSACLRLQAHAMHQRKRILKHPAAPKSYCLTPSISLGIVGLRQKSDMCGLDWKNETLALSWVRVTDIYHATCDGRTGFLLAQTSVFWQNHFHWEL